MKNMKVVWIVNVAVADAITLLNEKGVEGVTWIENILHHIKENVNVVVCCPVSGSELICGDKDGVRYYGIPRKGKRGITYDKNMKVFFGKVFEQERPDIIHIWGSEYPHTLCAIEAAETCGLLNHTVCSIQGLVSIYALHFMSTIPFWVRYLMVPKNFIIGFNLRQSQKAYQERGKYEIEAIRKLRHVIGRTAWDKACVTQINPNIQYYKNNECLRDIFYKSKWERENCESYRIFLSRGSSPIKGMHIALEAMGLLKHRYPSMHLYVTGRNILGHLTLEEKLRLNPYDWYIRREIRKKGLDKNVSFLGTLSAEQMCEQYLKANVFILPSSIENSPNSLGEAMLLGVPAVAADVGGVASMTKADEVYLFPHDEPYILAYYIGRVFEESDTVTDMTAKAKQHAMETHDVKTNMLELLNIYKKMLSGETANKEC